MSRPVAELSSRVPPHNLDAEESVLGAMLLRQEALEIAAELLEAEDFYRDSHRILFRELIWMNMEGLAVDPLIFANYLDEKGILEGVGDKAYILLLLDTCPNPYHVAHYSRLVKDAAKKRAVIDLGYQLVSAGHNGGGVDEALAEAQQIFSPVIDEVIGTGIGSVGDHLERWRQELVLGQTGQTCSGLESGFPHFDNIANGLSGINIIGGGTSSGKTTFAGQLGCQVAEANAVPVLFYSFEQGARDIMVRDLSRLSGVRNRDIARGSLAPFSTEVSELDAALTGFQDIANLLYVFGPETEFSFDRASNTARHLMRKHNTEKCLVILDSIHDIHPAGNHRGEYERLNAVCQGIVHLVATIGSPVVITSEINRQSYRNSMSRDEALRAFRDSGRIEFCADVATILEVRDGTFDINPREMRLRVLKNRMGEVGNVHFRFYTDVSAFTETDQPWPECD